MGVEICFELSHTDPSFCMHVYLESFANAYIILRVFFCFLFAPFF